MGKRKKSPVAGTLNLVSNESDLNWMYTGRLRVRAAAGDEEARKELEELENTPVHSFIVSPADEPEEKQDEVSSAAGPVRMVEDLPIDDIVETDRDYSAEYKKRFGKDPEK